MRVRWPVAITLLAGCPDRTISEVPVGQEKVETVDMPAVPRRDLDLLFVVDSSRSMTDEQASLMANFPRMVDVLETIDGGLPNIQIGVITPDLGTSASDGSLGQALGGCSGRGQDGVLRELTPGGPRYLRSVAGPSGRETNFPGTLAQAFSQLATVGAAGCGIEQHLEATLRATDGSHPENAGFIRPDAYLGIVLIADEDDCSLARSSLFNAGANAADFRCSKQAVVCGDPAVPLDETLGPRDNCRPREDAGELNSIDRYVDHLLALKPNSLDVVVAGIIGNPDNVSVAPNPDSGNIDLGNSCVAPSQGKAEAPVRMASFLEQFATRNTRASICDGDLTNGLVQIGALLKQVVINPCFKTTPIDADPNTPGPQYDCSVLEVRRRPNLPDEEVRVIASCQSNLGTPCWRIEADPEQCKYESSPEHLKLVIDRAGQPVDSDIYIRASCVTTTQPAPPT